MLKRKLGLSCIALFAMPWLASAGVISSGTVEIPGTYSFDFDAGVVPPAISADTDVFWHQFTSTTRALEPSNGAGIVNLGTSATFSLITLAQLEALTYGATGIDGSDGTSLLVTGDVFAVHTNLGNFAKAVVLPPDPAQGDGLKIQWVTDAPSTVAEPANAALVCIALMAGMILAGWRRRSAASARPYQSL